MGKFLVRWTGAVAALMLMAATVAPVQAEKITQERVEIQGTLTNPCNNENIGLSGYINLRVFQTEDGSGGQHQLITQNGNLSGESESGAKYRLLVAAQIGAHISAEAIATGDGQTTSTIVINQSLIGQGKAPDLKIELRQQIVTNANGEVVHTTTELSTTCR